MALSEYRLSEEADKDIENIFDYTLETFGIDQAVKYLTDLESVLSGLPLNPEMGKARSEIKIGLRSFPYVSHVVFYRILPDHIRIVRVLHASRDVPKFFD